MDDDNIPQPDPLLRLGVWVPVMAGSLWATSVVPWWPVALICAIVGFAGAGRALIDLGEEEAFSDNDDDGSEPGPHPSGWPTPW